MRASVQSSVGKPLAVGPFARALSTLTSCSSVSRGKRPARCAPSRPCTPCSRHVACHCEAVSRDTSSSRTTSAWAEPSSNIFPARSRRWVNASKSRRGRTRRLVVVGTDVLEREEGVMRTVSHVYHHYQGITERSLEG